MSVALNPLPVERYGERVKITQVRTVAGACEHEVSRQPTPTQHVSSHNCDSVVSLPPLPNLSVSSFVRHAIRQSGESLHEITLIGYLDSGRGRCAQTVYF